MDVQGDIAKNYSVIREELLNTGVIENVALSDHHNIYGGNNTAGLTWQGKTCRSTILISTQICNPEFMKTSGIKVLKGEIFNTDSVITKSINVLITESFEKLMGKESAVGKTLDMKAIPAAQLLKLLV